MNHFSRKEITEAILTGNSNNLLEKILINEVSVDIDFLVLRMRKNNQLKLVSSLI
ncbi:MAG: hypothetical protein HeimC3_14270 [Candidatus Heimdallarchaeota archaeon LC_3]|nr:MAG: hypothetical protein HeimC3_14270 [Candidatus Heimdallarchaeota archaeon LC_3]